ncbi:MAG TPA: TusE/DsrC/DsvC family sulfur relay protein [Azospirillum sp.]|nr:TusE/DsrC/DsvC family sulfur relay protein [Azospirillum sp.]
MPELDVQGRTIAVSEAGWLENVNEWDEDIARAVAEQEGVALTDAHWDIIRTTRTFFEENGVIPEARVFSKIMKEQYGAERATQQYFFSLFPHGLLKQANKIAGLPRPKGCS